MNIYYEFWSKSFALDPVDFENRETRVIHSGRYLEQHGDKYVFHFFDLTTGKEVISAPLSRASDPFAGLTRQFDDLDFGFRTPLTFKPAQNLDSIRQLQPIDTALSEFLDACSEDDRETLDLTFENEFAFGFFEGEILQGVARAALTRAVPQLADITILVRPEARGRRLSTPLVSALIADLLRRNLVPKYRVAADNFASQAIAKRLGLTPLFRVQTWG